MAAESAAVDTLLDRLQSQITEHGQADVQDVLSYRLPSISIAALLGIDEHDMASFRRHSLAFANLLEPGLTRRDLAEADQSHAELAEFFDWVIEDQRRSPTGQLASFLVHAHDTDPQVLAADELNAMFISIFVAGTMNTSSFIGNGIAALLDSPRVAADLRRDPALAGPVVAEILRHDAPMQVTRRMTVEDLHLGGRDLPAGTELGVVIGSANRDPRAYSDPDAFVPDRPGPPPLSFGGGAYFCIGAAMGQQEGELVFTKLVQCFPHLQAGGTPVHNLRSVLRGYLHLPVTTAART